MISEGFGVMPTIITKGLSLIKIRLVYTVTESVDEVSSLPKRLINERINPFHTLPGLPFRSDLECITKI